MDSSVSARIIAISISTQAVIMGMVAENERRMREGYSMAYGEDSFFTEALELENKVRDLLSSNAHS